MWVHLCCGMWNLELQHVGSSSPTGIEPRPPALGAWSLSHWTTREVPEDLFKMQTRTQ